MADDHTMRSKLTATLQLEWRWILKDEWSLLELQTLIEVANDITRFIDTLERGIGRAWMQRNLSGIKFQHSHGLLAHILTRVNGNFPTSFVWPGGMVNLFAGWAEMPRSREHAAHELGHVLENKRSWGLANVLGGGPGDRLIKSLGGRLLGKPFRMMGGVNLPQHVRYKTGRVGEYGNHSVADYFAETFSLAIYQPDAIPPAALVWMRKYLVVEESQ